MKIMAIYTTCPINFQSITDSNGTIQTGRGAGLMMKVVDADGKDHIAGHLSAMTINRQIFSCNDLGALEISRPVAGKIMKAVFENNRIKYLFGDAHTLHVISEVYIEEEFRRMGLGTAMLTIFMRQFPGTYALMAETNEKPWLMKYYCSLGFTAISSDDDGTVMARGDECPMMVRIDDGNVITEYGK